MYRAAVIGEPGKSVIGFRALGLTVITDVQGADAAAELHRLAKENYAVIFITEQIAVRFQAILRVIWTTPRCGYPLFRQRDGVIGIGDSEVHKAVERAVGATFSRTQNSQFGTEGRLSMTAKVK
jgi:V/A-type H+-transporting ATPase subunit F